MSVDATDPIALALAAAPDTPAGRQAAWYLRRLHGLGEGATLADQAHYAPSMPDGFRAPATDTAQRQPR